MKSKPGEKIKLCSVDEILGVPSCEEIQEIEIRKIRSFKNHPYKVVEDEKLMDLMESIKVNGILNPVIIRPDGNGGYEMISGHRRLLAALLLGLEIIPAYVRKMTDDQATIAMVDANLQRESVLPSEKAFAYKMKYEAMRRSTGRPQKNVSHFGTHLRTDEELAQQVGESRNQIQRYMRLTELIPEILDLVDRERIALTTAVDISYFSVEIQKWIYDYIKDNGVIKPLQVTALRRFEHEHKVFGVHEMIEIFNASLPKRKTETKVTIAGDKLKYYFPDYYSTREIEEVILNLLDRWKEEQK